MGIVGKHMAAIEQASDFNGGHAFNAKQMPAGQGDRAGCFVRLNAFGVPLAHEASLLP
jgi:hypothetical protein